MSAFESYVQIELPKRPYLDADVSSETVLIRRGAGPRQMAAVTISEGQVLGMVNGQLVGTDVSVLGNTVRKAVLTVGSPTATWTITHNLGSENVIVQAFDEGKFVVIPNSIQVVDEDTVELKFSTAQAGVARVIFLD